MMALTALLGLVRRLWQKTPAAFAMAGAVGGGISAYLMYDEQSGGRSPALIAVQWTGLFWFGFFACIGVAICAVWFYSKRSLGP